MEAYNWRQEREWERTAWLAFHTLVPWLEKGSKLTPRDLLAAADPKEEAPVLTREEAHAELEKLKREMGAA
jgi:hypothetical protein